MSLRDTLSSSFSRPKTVSEAPGDGLSVILPAGAPLSG